MSNEDRQIQAMIEFIERDAEEKAKELTDEAKALYDSEKANMVEAQKRKVVSQAEERKKQLEVDRRVARAQISKQERMRVMEARTAVMDDAKRRTEEEIRKLVKDQTKYKQLLADLLRQSAIAIAADADVFVRREDEGVVKGLLKQAEQAAEKAIGSPIVLKLAKDSLPAEESWGGVMLKSAGDHKVVCDNTLAARTAHCFDEQLPTIRYNLFHEKAEL